MKTILKRDHRLFPYQYVFGSTLQFDETLLVDAGFLDTQPVGNIDCVLYSADKVKSGETGKKYDHVWLGIQARKTGKMTSTGMTPQDGFSVAIKGQKVVPTGEIETSPAYFQTEIGKYDFFTNVKSAMQLEHNDGKRRPIACGTFWYAEWGGVLPNGIMPEGKTHTSDHEWVVCGWDKEHPNCFKIDAHLGYYMYIPQDVFNKAMDATYGSVALTIAATSEEGIEWMKANSYSFIQSWIDRIYNALKIIQAKINNLKPMPPLSPPPIDPPAPIVEVRPVEKVEYLWDTKENARHSCRVIMDEEGLTYTTQLVNGKQYKVKDILCACIQQESQFDNTQIGKNINEFGVVTSRDWGVVQINDHYQIGPGKPFASVDDVVNNPDKAVRFMIKMYKAGSLKLWISYKSGAFIKYL